MIKMISEKLFGNMSIDELKKYERDTNGIVLFNSSAENALSLQATDQSELHLYIDKVDIFDKSYPKEFILQPAQIANLYNYLTDIIHAHPDKYKISY